MPKQLPTPLHNKRIADLHNWWKNDPEIRAWAANGERFEKARTAAEAAAKPYLDEFKKYEGRQLKPESKEARHAKALCEEIHLARMEVYKQHGFTMAAPEQIDTPAKLETWIGREHDVLRRIKAVLKSPAELDSVEQKLVKLCEQARSKALDMDVAGLPHPTGNATQDLDLMRSWLRTLQPVVPQGGGTSMEQVCPGPLDQTFKGSLTASKETIDAVRIGIADWDGTNWSAVREFLRTNLDRTPDELRQMTEHDIRMAFATGKTRIIHLGAAVSTNNPVIQTISFPGEGKRTSPLTLVHGRGHPIRQWAKEVRKLITDAIRNPTKAESDAGYFLPQVIADGAFDRIEFAQLRILIENTPISSVVNRHNGPPRYTDNNPVAARDRLVFLGTTDWLRMRRDNLTEPPDWGGIGMVGLPAPIHEAQLRLKFLAEALEAEAQHTEASQASTTPQSVNVAVDHADGMTLTYLANKVGRSVQTFRDAAKASKVRRPKPGQHGFMFPWADILRIAKADMKKSPNSKASWEAFFSEYASHIAPEKTQTKLRRNS